MVKEESTLDLVHMRAFLEMEDVDEDKGKEQVENLFGEVEHVKWSELSKEIIEFEKKHGNDYIEKDKNIKENTFDVSKLYALNTKEDLLEKAEQVVDGINNLDGVSLASLRVVTFRGEDSWSYTLRNNKVYE